MNEFSKLNGYNVCDETARQSIEGINKVMSEIMSGKNKLVVFGDSWSDLNVANSIYSTYVANSLNVDLHNYAKSAAGFIKPESNLISTQVTQFINSDIDKEKVKYIVLMGGINDYRYGVEMQTLNTEITRLINILKPICTNAKILFVSNCQYPYTKVQSSYWNQLHNNLRYENVIATLNLDGLFGVTSFADDLFHLKQVHQRIMGSNVVSALTGGEIKKYQDWRTFENTDLTLRYNSEKISDNFAIVQIIITPKVSKTNYSLSIGSGKPCLSYDDAIGLRGSATNGNINIFCDVMPDTVNCVCSTALTIGKEYTLDIPVYLA